MMFPRKFFSAIDHNSLFVTASWSVLNSSNATPLFRPIHMAIPAILRQDRLDLIMKRFGRRLHRVRRHANCKKASNRKPHHNGRHNSHSDLLKF